MNKKHPICLHVKVFIFLLLLLLLLCFLLFFFFSPQKRKVFSLGVGCSTEQPHVEMLAQEQGGEWCVVAQRYQQGCWM